MITKLNQSDSRLAEIAANRQENQFVDKYGFRVLLLIAVTTMLIPLLMVKFL